MGMKLKVTAIDPTTDKLVPAILIQDHFGKGKHAINFGGINSANYDANKIAWELTQ